MKKVDKIVNKIDDTMHECCDKDGIPEYFMISLSCFKMFNKALKMYNTNKNLNALIENVIYEITRISIGTYNAKNKTDMKIEEFLSIISKYNVESMIEITNVFLPIIKSVNRPIAINIITSCFTTIYLRIYKNFAEFSNKIFAYTPKEIEELIYLIYDNKDTEFKFISYQDF